MLKSFVLWSHGSYVQDTAFVPMKEGPCTRVGQGVGMFFIWPRWLVMSANSNAIPQRQCVTKPISPQTQLQPRPRLDKPRMDFLKSLPSFVRVLYDAMGHHNRNSTYSFEGNVNVFGVNRDLIVPWVDFEDFWHFKLLPATILSLHQL